MFLNVNFDVQMNTNSIKINNQLTSAYSFYKPSGFTLQNPKDKGQLLDWAKAQVSQHPEWTVYKDIF